MDFGNKNVLRREHGYVIPDIGRIKIQIAEGRNVISVSIYQRIAQNELIFLRFRIFFNGIAVAFVAFDIDNAAIFAIAEILIGAIKSVFDIIRHDARQRSRR